MRRIKTWPRFAKRIRPGRTDLLRTLPAFHNPILVAGCQRSGGTMLAKAFTEHPDIADFSWSKDAELDAALLLSGTQQPPQTDTQTPRYCFQTTYLNERAVEYQQHSGAFHLIWLLRNPYSVVYSMLYNWKRFALNEVFLACGLELLPLEQSERYDRFGLLTIRPIDRACYAWLGKVQQCQMLLKTLPEDRFITLNYEDLVQNRASMLNDLFRFTGLEPQTDSAGDISTRSMQKSKGLSARERGRVEQLCESVYREQLENAIRLRP